MAIEVHSPHTGRPVRVREQDVGRSVRDEEGKIFFVLPRADGTGHYGSITRTGGPKEEQRYLEMLAKEEQARASGQALSQKQIHDATGGKRSSWRGKLVILALLAMVLVLVYLFTIGPFGQMQWQAPPKIEDSQKDAAPKDAPPKDAQSKDTPPKDVSPKDAAKP